MRDELPVDVRRWCLLAAAACALPLLAQVPGWLAAVFVATALVAVLLRKPWPTWALLLMTALLAGLVLWAFHFGIGRDTSCAGLLAMLVLKPFETFRHRDAESLLGFSLFAPFAAFLQDQGPGSLGMALPAVALSVSAWAVLAQGTGGVTWLAPLRKALPALAMAIPMTLAGFWLFPRLASPLWGLPENSVGRMSLGDRMRPNEWLDELVDDSPAMRVRFIGATPPRQQMYWRGPVLTHFDGEAWTRDIAALQAPPPAIAATGVKVSYEVMLEPTERRDLLVLDWPLGAPDNSRLTSELTATVGEPINNLMRYTGRSAVSTRFLGELPAWQRHAALLVPRNHDPRTRALAAQWRHETPDPLQLTRRFLAWMRRDFKYSISAPPVGFHATDEFLFGTRTGFCQHFSSAYAVFMRSAGVPARVVTGYVGGHYNRIGEYWLLKHKDAHAWAEIWIDGRGWIRVDPTAAIAPANILDTLDDLQARQQGGFAGAASQMVAPMLDGSDFLRRQWNELILGFNASRQQSLLRPFGIRNAEAWQLVAAFGLGSALALGLTLWFLLRAHRDRSHPLIQAWRIFTRRLRRAGYAKAKHEPPLCFARRVAADLASDGNVLALSQRYSDWRYAGARLAASQQLALINELRAFRISRRNRHPGSPP